LSQTAQDNIDQVQCTQLQWLHACGDSAGGHIKFANSQL